MVSVTFLSLSSFFIVRYLFPLFYFHFSIRTFEKVSLPFVFIISALLTTIYAFDITLFSNVLGNSVETGVMLFYLLLFAANFLLPSATPGMDTKNSFFRLVRLVFFPAASISFPEVLLADAFTSLSKVFKDVGVTLIAAYAQISGRSIVSLHSTGMVLVALLACAIGAE